MADIRLKIEAETLEELFRAGAFALNEVLKPGFCKENGNNIRHIIETRSVDTTALLVDFLSDLLTLSYTENAIFCEITIEAFGGQFVKARAAGRKVSFFDEDIKAVTYHEAEVRKNESEHYETIVIFDI